MLLVNSVFLENIFKSYYFFVRFIAYNILLDRITTIKPIFIKIQPTKGMFNYNFLPQYYLLLLTIEYKILFA